jgi:hypothetical protein
MFLGGYSGGFVVVVVVVVVVVDCADAQAVFSMSTASEMIKDIRDHGFVLWVSDRDVNDVNNVID